MDISKQKRILRAEIGKKGDLSSISVSEKLEKSRSLCVLGESLLPKGGVCAFYSAVGSEPNLSVLVEKALQCQLVCVFPKICNDGMYFCCVSGLWQLKPSMFGILAPETPIYHQDIDVFFIPGLAFDELGRRLGRGSGYYDRFLSFFPHSFKVGVCFEQALFPEVPVGQHDIYMDAILTEDRVIFCNDIRNPSNSAD